MEGLSAQDIECVIMLCIPFLDFYLLGAKDKHSICWNQYKSAMHCGVSQGIIHEIQTAISYYEAKFDFLTVILTGGDAQMLPKPLKNSIFAHSNFLAKGLNFLLASNTNS